MRLPCFCPGMQRPAHPQEKYGTGALHAGEPRAPATGPPYMRRQESSNGEPRAPATGLIMSQRMKKTWQKHQIHEPGAP